MKPNWNVRVILDGEEEASSPSLVPAIAKYRDKLRADVMVILDGPAHSSGRPTVAYGARGIVTLNLTVFGPRVGVHSGNYGNWVPNPAQRLASLLATMKDEDGRVLVAGFNDGIQPLTAEEQAMLAAVPDDSAEMLKTFGIAAPSKAFPRLQEALQYPTLNVRGLQSAHVGAGARTIIPDRATAAMDIRLVKETSPASLVDKLRAHVRAQGYHLVEGEPSDADRAAHSKLAAIVVSESPTKAFRTSPSDPQVKRIVAGMTSDRWRASCSAANARRHCPDCPVHRSPRLPGDPGADSELRQQSARGEREPADRALLLVDRDSGGDTGRLLTLRHVTA